MQKRKNVTNEEFTVALADTNNTNIIRSVCNGYRNILSEDELHSCGLNALWRTLQYHRPEYNQKFTTSLYRFIDWECKREVRRVKNSRKYVVASLSEQGYDQLSTGDLCEKPEVLHLRECISLLPEEWQRTVIRQYYLDNRTMEEIGVINGYSKEAARQKINKAMASLKDICKKAG